MTNMVLFEVTVIFYFLVWTVSTSLGPRVIKPLRQEFKGLAVIALLCLPLSINGNVFTVLGNAKSDKSIFSLFSIYQKAERDAVSVFGSLAQFAGNDAGVLVGIVGWQEAGNNAILGIGLAGYQKAEKSSASMGVGLAGRQKAGIDAVLVLGGVGFQESRRDAATLMGINGYQTGDRAAVGFILISGYQESKEGKVENVIGITGYQKAGNRASVGCCLAGLQDAGETDIGLGLVGYQNATKIAKTIISAALLQRAGTRERSFAIWSELKGD